MPYLLTRDMLVETLDLHGFRGLYDADGHTLLLSTMAELGRVGSLVPSSEANLVVESGALHRGAELMYHIGSQYLGLSTQMFHADPLLGGGPTRSGRSGTQLSRDLGQPRRHIQASNTMRGVDARALAEGDPIRGADGIDDDDASDLWEAELDAKLAAARALLGIPDDDAKAEDDSEAEDFLLHDDVFARALYRAEVSEARDLLGIPDDDSDLWEAEIDSEAEETDPDADEAYEAALAEAGALFALDDDAFAATLAAAEADETQEAVVKDGGGAPEVLLRVAWADLEDSPSEYDEEWEQVHARNWATVATSSHLPAAPETSPAAQSRRAARRSAQRQRQRHRTGPAPEPS